MEMKKMKITIEQLLKDVDFRWIEVSKEVSINDKGEKKEKKKVKGEHNEYTIDQIKQNRGCEKKSTHKSFYLKYSKVYCIDIDQKEIPEKIEKLIKKYKIPFTKSTIRGYHLYFLSDIPTFKNEIKVFYDFEGDFIHYVHNIWEPNNNIVYNASKLPVIPWKILKPLCNLENLFSSMEPKQIKQKPIKNLNKDLLELVMMLNQDRADYYKYWIKVGWALWSDSKDNLPIWIEFSKQSHKFTDGECDEIWKNIKFVKVTIGTIHYWAKLDNPEKYKKYIFNNISVKIPIDHLYSDDGCARLLYELCDHKVVCTQEDPLKFYYFDNGLWHKMEGTTFLRKVINGEVIPFLRKKCIYLQEKNSNEEINDGEKQTNDTLITNIQKKINTLKCYKGCTSIINQSIQYFKDSSFFDKLDINTDIINIGGLMIYDLNLNEFRESLPSDMCATCTSVTFEEINDLNLERVHKIIDDIFPNPEIKEYFLLNLSYCLSGNPPEKFHIWMGQGANGKSLISKYLKEIFGNYFCELPVSLLTSKRSKATEANPELARSKSARLVFFNEPEEGSKLNNAIIKELTGGDSISTRELYGNPFQFTPQFHCHILCNTNFGVQDVRDNALPRRLNYLKFKSQFVENPILDNEKEMDIELKSLQTINELRGSFMYLLIEYFKKLSQNKFKIEKPDKINEDQDEFIDNNNIVKRYATEELEKTNDNHEFITVKSLFQNFKYWCKQQNEEINIKEKEFKDRLILIFPTYKERANINKKYFRSIFTNLKFVDEENENENHELD